MSLSPCSILAHEVLSTSDVSVYTLRSYALHMRVNTFVHLEDNHPISFSTLRYIIKSRGNSVSIVSGYGLDDRAIGVRSPAEAREFSSNLCVQTGSGAHPASCTMGTGDKARPGRDADRSPLSSAEVVKE
jgi:hypothetical protein